MPQTNGENTYPNLTAFAHFHKRNVEINTKNHLFSTHYGKTYIISVKFPGTVFEEHRMVFKFYSIRLKNCSWKPH